MSVPACKTLHMALVDVTSDSISPVELTDLAATLAVGSAFALPAALPSAPQVQVVDLFCGAGGLSAGFEMLGRRTGACGVVAAADVDDSFRATYATNLGVEPSGEDLGRVAGSRSGLSRFIGELGLDSARPTILVGGPPCQGFSAHRKRNWDASDARNELVGAYAKIAVEMAPDVVVMENVPEILSGRYWPHFEAFRSTLQAAGYEVTAQIHSLAEYGVAQERFRAVVIAARNAISSPPPILDVESFRTVRQQIGHLPSLTPGKASSLDPMHYCAAHRASTIEVLRQVPKDGGNRPKGVGPACSDRVDGFRDVYGRLAWDRPAVTITGSARNAASGRFAHPEQDRALSLREAALLQGFPDNYTFCGGNISRYQQVGNAVPARFGVVLAAHLVRHLLDSTYRQNSVPSLSEPARDSFSSSLWGLKGRRSA